MELKRETSVYLFSYSILRLEYIVVRKKVSRWKEKLIINNCVESIYWKPVRARLYPSRSHSKREYRNYDAEEGGIAGRRIGEAQREVRITESYDRRRAKQGVTTFVSIRAGRRKGWIDDDSQEFIPENRSVALEIGNNPRSLEVETPGSRSVPRLSLSRERGTGGPSSSSTLQRTRSSYAV